MFSGRFGNTSRRPYVEALVIIPRLDITSGVSFLVDTGADQTVLMPTDAVRMGIKYRSLHAAQTLSGIGGKCKSFRESAAIIFYDESNTRLVEYDIQIWIAEKKAAHLRCASLLGRNVLDRLHMSYNFSKKKLDFTVISADARAPVYKGHAQTLKAKIKSVKPLPQ
jgi:predicted aspartyl protease